MFNKNHWLAGLVFGSVLMLFSVVFFNPIFAATGINENIHFQGKVVNTDGTNVANGDYDFVFKLYTVDSAGTAIWTENRTSANQVTVTDGVFSVDLGSVTALPGSVDFNTDNIYLGIEFNGDGEMSPRIQFTAVPYAHNAAKVGGLTVTDTTSTLTIPSGITVAFSGSNDTTFTTSGSTNVTLPTTGTLATLAGSETLTNKIIGSTGLTFSGATTDITTGTNEHLSIMPNGTGNVGIGTTNPSFFIDARRDQDAPTVMRVYNDSDSANAIAGYLFGNSDYGGGFGIFSPSYTGGLSYTHLAGRMGLYGDHPLTGTTPLGIDIISPHTSQGDIRFFTGGYAAANEQMRLNIDGNLGIGTTNPTELLHVNGNILANGSVAGVTTLASSGGWTWTATTPNITINSAETFTLTDGTDTFTINTSGSLFSFIDGSSNGFTFDADTGPLFAGTARPARKEKLVPEYPGAVLTGDGSNNTGTMTSDFCEQGAHADIPDTNTTVCNTSGDVHNYYSWTTSQGSAQDYDIWVRWRIPDNFAAWDSNPIQIYAKRTDATNNAVTAFVYDTAGALNNAGGTQIAGTTWTQTAVSLSGGTWTAGSYVTIRITVAADTGGDSVQVGEINLNYLTNN